MPARSPFKELARSRFCEAFGTPIAVKGMDDEWSFEPRSKSACVKVVLHDTPLEATLWVQENENGHSQSVYNAAIKSRDDVDAVIETIEQHLRSVADRRASRSA